MTAVGEVLSVVSVSLERDVGSDTAGGDRWPSQARLALFSPQRLTGVIGAHLRRSPFYAIVS